VLQSRRSGHATVAEAKQQRSDVDTPEAV